MTKLIRDVRAEWHGETGTIHLLGEKINGKEFLLTEIMTDEPSFTMGNFENSDYEEWYNLALEEAHKQGYILEGEA